MIHTLTGDAFAGALRPPKVTGVSPLFRGKIRIDGVSIRAYVKPLPDQIQCPVKHKLVDNREVISEALGYVLAKACGFQVPSSAGVILLSQNQIPSAAQAALRELAGGQLQDDYLCWFSMDMNYPNLVQKHLDGVEVEFLRQRRIFRLIKQLAEAEETPRIIAFDDWLLNSDRHPGNLLANGGSLMLIDHGRIFVYPNWAPGSLGSLGAGYVPDNRLRTLLDSHEPNWSAKLPKTSEMIMAYNAFAINFRERGEAMARTVLADFFEIHEIDAVIQQIHSRYNSAAYAKAHGMVL